MTTEEKLIKATKALRQIVDIAKSRPGIDPLIITIRSNATLTLVEIGFDERSDPEK